MLSPEPQAEHSSDFRQGDTRSGLRCHSLLLWNARRQAFNNKQLTRAIVTFDHSYRLLLWGSASLFSAWRLRFSGCVIFREREACGVHRWTPTTSGELHLRLIGRRREWQHWLVRNSPANFACKHSINQCRTCCELSIGLEPVKNRGRLVCRFRRCSRKRLHVSPPH